MIPPVKQVDKGNAQNGSGFRKIVMDNEALRLQPQQK